MVWSVVTGDEPFGDPNDKNGIYRIERDGSFTVIADIGSWSADNPETDIFLDRRAIRHGALPRRVPGHDGHHNWVLRVGRNGSINEIATFGNVVPTVWK